MATAAAAEFRRYTAWFTWGIAFFLALDAGARVLAHGVTFRALGDVWVVGMFGYFGYRQRRNSVRISPERIWCGSTFQEPVANAAVADLAGVRWENPGAICFALRSGEAFVIALGGLCKSQKEEVRKLLREYVPAYRDRQLRSEGEPVLPLTVRWPDDEPEVLGSWEEVETGLEFFDSDSESKPIEVVDALGRPVRLVVEACSVTLCELKPGQPSQLLTDFERRVPGESLRAPSGSE